MNNKRNRLLPDLEEYMQDSIKGFQYIDPERKSLLKKVAQYVEAKAKQNTPVNLTFICTHNSRRSHISQLWAQAAAHYYEVPGVTTYSAGTEATAFNPRAVKAMQNAGFSIITSDDSSNPKYSITIGEEFPPIIAFSKTIADNFNPQEDFAAIMTCDNADEACPIVNGSDARFPIKYKDPKIADNTPEEEAKYNERCQQICTEMMYMFSLVKL